MREWLGAFAGCDAQEAVESPSGWSALSSYSPVFPTAALEELLTSPPRPKPAMCFMSYIQECNWHMQL